MLLTEGLLRIANLVTSGTTRGSRFTASLARPDDRLGIELIPGARARHVSQEFDVEVAIDSRGFRGSEGIARGTGDEVRRVVVLGDSFAFGWGVEERDRFTERLAASLPGTEFENLGVPGTGTDQHLLIYEERSDRGHKADLVLLAYFIGAVARNGRSTDSGRPKPRFELDAGGLRYVPPPSTADGTEPPSERHERGLAIPFKSLLARHSEIYRRLRGTLGARLREGFRAHERDPYPQYAADDAAWKVTKAILLRLKQDVESDGRRFAIVIVPEAWHVEPGAPDVHRRTIADFSAASGIPSLDLSSSLTPRDYYPLDGHWTKEGHAHAAAAIAAFLTVAATSGR